LKKKKIQIDFNRFKDNFCPYCHRKHDGMIGFEEFKNVDENSHPYSFCMHCENSIKIIDKKTIKVSNAEMIEMIGISKYLKLHRAMIELKEELRNNGLEI